MVAVCSSVVKVRGINISCGESCQLICGCNLVICVFLFFCGWQTCMQQHKTKQNKAKRRKQEKEKAAEAGGSEVELIRTQHTQTKRGFRSKADSNRPNRK